MRLIDVCVASLIGLSSVAVLAAWSPYQLREQGRLYAEQASLHDLLVSLVSTLGVPWLHGASPDALCAALLSYSNSTLLLSAEGRGFLCSTPPQGDLPHSSLTLVFPEGNVTLLAWQLAKP